MQMKSSTNARRPATAGRTLRFAAAAALLATTLMAATAAHASLVVTSALRDINADTSTSDAIETKSFATSGLFKQALNSQDDSSGPDPFARARQETDIQALSFIGTGSSQLNLFDGAFGDAESVFSLFFTLSSAFEFDGSATLEASGNAFSHATFVLEHLGVGGGIVESGTDTELTLSGTLGPGDYSMVVRASSISIDPNEAGDASFSIRLDFTELVDPPTAVPEPQSLALVFAGLLACGAMRRRG